MKGGKEGRKRDPRKIWDEKDDDDERSKYEGLPLLVVSFKANCSETEPNKCLADYAMTTTTLTISLLASSRIRGWLTTLFKSFSAIQTTDMLHVMVHTQFFNGKYVQLAVQV